jgi:hypothetical protein
LASTSLAATAVAGAAAGVLLGAETLIDAGCAGAAVPTEGFAVGGVPAQASKLAQMAKKTMDLKSESILHHSKSGSEEPLFAILVLRISQ